MGNAIKHSVCHWPFEPYPFEGFLLAVKAMGVQTIDLAGPEQWPMLKKHGFHCAMCNGAEISLEAGWNDPNHHSELTARYSDMIPKVAEAGFKNLICFSGNRNGMDDETGLQNCIDGLSQIRTLAEKHGVIIQMELFNQQDHPDYMCDATAWGVRLCQALGPNFKLLYDIYHMQIQEGDIIKTIRDNIEHIGHFHTAGVPGRCEIDERQELNYPAIMRAIASTGYQGYVAQEFLPTEKGSLDTLAEAFAICTVTA